MTFTPSTTSSAAGAARGATIRVMVVDDSMVVRKMFSDLLQKEADIDVVATARNGQNALDILTDKTKPIEVDVITMDVEMPVMDGIEALGEVMKIRPNVKVIMVSSLTEKGAGKALEALSKGAVECIGKPSTGDAGVGLEEFGQQVANKVRGIGAIAPVVHDKAVQTAASLADVTTQPALVTRQIPPLKALAIASSTGGPQALTKLFTDWNGHKFSVPVFITQHMPAKFTKTLAEQLSKVSGMTCKEGEDGEVPKPGHVYIAPGDYHMVLEKRLTGPVIRLNQEAPENFCRPAADPMLRSLVEVYERNMLLTVLTGMGADGLKGAEILHEKGGIVWAQDEASSVVWGMPGAVSKAGICQKILPLNDIPNLLAQTLQENTLWQ